MKVAVIVLYATVIPHFETNLEIIQKHLDQGDEVTVLSCSADLLACDANPFHDAAICVACMDRRKRGLKLLSGEVRDERLLSYLDAAARQAMQSLQVRFSSVEELKAYHVDGFDIGYAVLSSLVSRLRNPNPDMQSNAALIENYIHSAFAIYRSLLNYLGQNEVDSVYAFNGRFAPLRGALRACQKVSAPCFLHDRGQDLQHYALFPNYLPHDRIAIEERIRRQWAKAATDPDREQTATQFFLERANGVVQARQSFVQGQQKGLLPDNWDATKKNIVLFTSSESEFVAIGDIWRNPLYPNQLAGIESIIHSLAHQHDNMHLYVRMHPNLRGMRDEQTVRLRNLQADFLTVILPESEISTYALVQGADVVLTFGSTMGIEAVFWDKPSILAGVSYYRHLGGTYNPATHDELIALLTTTDLPPKGKKAALMFGYYMKTFGIPFEYFRANGIFDGEFKGRRIKLSPRAAWAVRLLNRITPVGKMANWLLYRMTRKKLIGSVSGERHP